ncbi:MAG: hypothetical protein U9R27_08860 [Campylobacterota bacterium]|nr:hypothetical protein [Campylobacterota bacterium]
MSIKKLAIFVEGKTELIFIEKLVEEMAGIYNVEIQKRVLQGQNRCPFIEEFNDLNSQYKIRIYNSCNDAKVLSDIKENYQALLSKDFFTIIGLRDLYPIGYEKKERIQNGLKTLLVNEDLIYTKMILAVMEIETWFIAEFNHYQNIDKHLTLEEIRRVIDLQEIENFEREISRPANTLNDIYQLINRHWTKSEKQIRRTVVAIDYENLYIHTKEKVPSLKELIDTLDEFFSK